MKYRNYTDDDIIKSVETSISFAEALRKLGLRPIGGNYKTLRRHITRLGLNTSHMLGQAHNKIKTFKKFEDLTRIDSIKKRVLKQRGHCCEGCGLHSWLGNKIPLELHHVDGCPENNSKDNLQLLCPNCHSLTDNFRNRRRKL